MSGRPPAAPALLGAVATAKYVRPASLAPGARCRLRAQALDPDSQRPFPQMSQSPRALVGTALHRAIELADGRSNIVEVFQALVRREDERLAASQSSHHLVPLRRSIGETAWQSVLDLAKRRGGGGAAFDLELLGVKPQAPGGGPMESLKAEYEKELFSDDLRLRGRIDLVERDPDGAIEVTDWKTGKVVDDEGVVKAEYRLQLAAYSMLCQERWPGSVVRTYLFDGEQLEVKTEQSDEEEVHRIVGRLLAGLDGGATSDAADLAQPGDECRWCGIRDRCPQYRLMLLESGAGFTADPEVMSGDVAGRVEAVEERRGGTIATLRTRQGSRVQLRGLSDRFDLTGLEGEEILCFGFKPRWRMNRQTGARCAPNTFYELDPNSESARAWQAVIFTLG